MLGGQIIGSGGAVLKIVQAGTILTANATSATATISSAVTANTRITHAGTTPNNTGFGTTAARTRVEQTNTTTVTVYTNTADAAINYTTAYISTEFYGGAFKSMQRGTIICVAGASTTATISAVTTSKTETTCLGATTSANLGANGTITPKVVQTNTTTVTADCGSVSAADQTTGYQAAESY